MLQLDVKPQLAYDPRSRLAVNAFFFLSGLLGSTWVSRIPSIQTKLQLSDGPLGIALLGIGLGALLSMLFAGGLCSAFGSQRVLKWAAPAACLALMLPSFARSFPILWLSTTLLGLSFGFLEVSMNVHGVLVERRAEKPIMSSFHGVFSLGAISGAALGAGFAWMNVVPPLHFALSTLAGLVITANFLRWLLPAAADATGNQAAANSHLHSVNILRHSEKVRALSLITFCAFLFEGAMCNWSGVYLKNVLKTNEGVAALGFTAVAAAMCAGRLMGDSLIKKYGRLTLVFGGSALVLTGLGLALFAPDPTTSLAGFGLVGLGISNMVPICFSAAGDVPGVEAGEALGAICTVAYTGLLAGPTIIGFAAEAYTLRVALLLTSLFVITPLFFSQYLRRLR